ncbi:GFA family protein [Aliikangiella sp. IMCC44359]|uniref:GFA family protein n=1 Tax=Aliikangiella sp. IMCC44359 TaxID=3459125 RepID=UPI00403AB0C3
MNKVAQCICGAVKLEVSSRSNEIGACHCTTCRRWSGGPLLAVDCQDNVTINAEDKVTIFNSSDWAERGFCNQCGTHLFYRIKQNNQYIVPVGLFDDAESFSFGHQVFIDEKPDYYDFANSTKNMTGEDVFAMYAQPDS